MATIALNFKTNAKETDREMMSLGKSIGAVGGVASRAFKAMAGGAILLGGAITALAISSAKGQKELTNMARLAGLSTREFEKLTFATNKFDISAEQFADISKDVTEKLGEFSKVGTGAFTDFKDIMGLSTASAKSLATQLGKMPAPQALLEITRMMEGAGVGRSQMSFVLESLGSDLTKLIPLLKDNGKEWVSLSSQFDKATSTFALSTKMSGDLIDLSSSFDLVSASASSVATSFSATFAPAITSALDAITGALGEEGFKTSIQNASVGIIEFGIFAIDALKPVVSVVQLLLTMLNMVGTAVSAGVSGIGGFVGALAGGTSIGQAVDIASELENDARDRGARREQSISDVGAATTGGLEGLSSILQKLQTSIELGNSNTKKVAVTVQKGASAQRAGSREINGT